MTDLAATFLPRREKDHRSCWPGRSGVSGAVHFQPEDGDGTAHGKCADFSRFMQEMTVTTAGGREYKGLLNGVYDEDKKEAAGLYVDLGQDRLEEVMDLGVQPEIWLRSLLFSGNMKMAVMLTEPLMNGRLPGDGRTDETDGSVPRKWVREVQKQWHE